MKKWKRDHLGMVMGILNVTPDSFSDGGKYMELEEAVVRAMKMAEDGAAIIDVGGISTRPGFSEVSRDEELARIIPVIKAIREKLPDIWISVDTWRAAVAEQAVLAGADMINDQWGAKKEPEIAQIAAKYNIPICLMHNRENAQYENFLEDVKTDLLESVAIAKAASVPDEHIILDPGFGFVKTPAQNLEVLRRIDEIVALGYEVLLGTSRKSTIGLILGGSPDDRMEGTGATVVYGFAKGCTITRVHDVLPIARMIRMTDAITGKLDITKL
ncbi:Dihydropteroate synthase [Listeria ivanovii subsp. londoniensis]|uniref:Dihydropteroate synthase n=2 Tax=Listeria ivanovii TaxID=1638 RepID=A0ABS1G7J1_LISIV|nr:dihydropteroate synthase [Listeria ivanovii]MBK1962859.1 dihydropteroate synthase [Listeria ivanovii subsp. londoniensis]VEH44643.1 Dihydropteroate synthase [Listeria ivanovii subsp. londoniensis]